MVPFLSVFTHRVCSGDMNQIHELKIHPEYFGPVSEGKKTFEIRKNDRDYRIGDTVILREFDPRTGEYTGRLIQKEVGYVSVFSQMSGWCVFSLL